MKAKRFTVNFNVALPMALAMKMQDVLRKIMANISPCFCAHTMKMDTTNLRLDFLPSRGPRT
eukprot:12892495-Prorocentrum_lima.AAC.1